MIAEWEAALGQADALAKELKFDEAKEPARSHHHGFGGRCRRMGRRFIP